MIMQRLRVPVSDLVPGDIVQQGFRIKEAGQLQETSRTIVVGRTEPDALPYRGHVHAVTRVSGIDPDGAREVVWLAVPDQPVTVIREP